MRRFKNIGLGVVGFCLASAAGMTKGNAASHCGTGALGSGSSGCLHVYSTENTLEFIGDDLYYGWKPYDAYKICYKKAGNIQHICWGGWDSKQGKKEQEFYGGEFEVETPGLEKGERYKYEVTLYHPDFGGNYPTIYGDVVIGSDPKPIPSYTYNSTSGLGDLAEGADVAVFDIGGGSAPEIVLLAYDSPNGPNTFRYKIGWDVNAWGNPSSGWTAGPYVPGAGDLGQGAGVALRDLNGNSRPEMIVMAVDAPAGANEYRYRVGWDLSTSGVVSSWSGLHHVPGLGWETDGAGAAFAQLDADPRPELIFVAYDDPAEGNNFWYKIGWNVQANGEASSWSGNYFVPGAGWVGEGAGVAFANLDADPRPEMVLMASDPGTSRNDFRYKIGWNVQANGHASSWGPVQLREGIGYKAHGAGVEITDLNGDDTPELLLMVYEDLPGANEFRYRFEQF